MKERYIVIPQINFPISKWQRYIPTPPFGFCCICNQELSCDYWFNMNGRAHPKCVETIDINSM